MRNSAPPPPPHTSWPPPMPQHDGVAGPPTSAIVPPCVCCQNAQQAQQPKTSANKQALNQRKQKGGKKDTHFDKERRGTASAQHKEQPNGILSQRAASCLRLPLHIAKTHTRNQPAPKNVNNRLSRGENQKTQRTRRGCTAKHDGVAGPPTSAIVPPCVCFAKTHKMHNSRKQAQTNRHTQQASTSDSPVKAIDCARFLITGRSLITGRVAQVRASKHTHRELLFREA